MSYSAKLSHKPIINAGKYNRKIYLYFPSVSKDSQGFPTTGGGLGFTVWANVKTTRGMTLIKNDSDFEKAYTSFTIRYPQNVTITRDWLIDFNGKTYKIEYINNINEANTELEIQTKEVTH